MRLLFLLLLLANLALAVGVMRGEPDSAGVQIAPGPAATGTAPLLLVSELPLADRPGKRSALAASAVPEEVQVLTDTPDPAPGTPQGCYRLEGIPDATALAAVRSRVEAAGGHVGSSGEVTAEKRRYWVLLPPFRSRVQAEPMMKRLRAAGVKDFYFITAGENRNTISLGLFSTAEAARRRVQQLAPLKLKLDVREVVSSSRSLSLEVTWEKSPAALSRATGLEGIQIGACVQSRRLQ